MPVPFAPVESGLLLFLVAVPATLLLCAVARLIGREIRQRRHSAKASLPLATTNTFFGVAKEERLLLQVFYGPEGKISFELQREKASSFPASLHVGFICENPRLEDWQAMLEKVAKTLDAAKAPKA